MIVSLPTLQCRSPDFGTHLSTFGLPVSLGAFFGFGFAAGFGVFGCGELAAGGFVTTGGVTTGGGVAAGGVVDGGVTVAGGVVFGHSHSWFPG